jgi:hypothetical protein
MKHFSVVSNLDSLIRSEEVRCMNFATLFKETGIHRIDLLMIDAEGCRAEILHLFDIPPQKPAIIHLKHNHVSIADHRQSLGTLVDPSHKFVISGENALAYLG